MTRVTALVLDWAACTAVTWVMVFLGMFQDVTHRGLITMGVFFVECTVGTAMTGGSFGQLLARICVARVDARDPEAGRLSIGRAALRTALICLVLPAAVIGVNRRGLHDLAAGTVVLSRR